MKKIVIGSLAAALVISGGLTINALADDDNLKISKTQNEKLIGMEKAKEVALTQVDGIIESVELEQRNGKTFYNVDIDAEKSKEYEVRVEAYTAKVLNIREDDDGQDDDDDQVPTNAKLITETKAIEIAQKQIKGTLSEIKLDSDDGQFEYEIELRTVKGKAEFTIDATTGKILESELDDDDDDDRYDD